MRYLKIIFFLLLIPLSISPFICPNPTWLFPFSSTCSQSKWLFPFALASLIILLLKVVSLFLAFLGFRRYKHLRWIKTTRWWWFFGTFILCFLVVATFRNFEISHYPAYILETIQHADFLVILGLVIGILACVIGMAVFEEVSGSNASNLKEFLILFNDILDDAKNDDQIIALLPTYFIGGTASVLTVKNDYIVEHRESLSSIKSALKRGVKIDIFCLDNTGINPDEYFSVDKADAGRMNYVISKKTTIPLLDFHYEVSRDRFYGNTSNVEEYFDHFYRLTRELQSATGNHPNFISLKNEYHTDEKIVIIINLTQHTAIFGSYTVASGIDLGGEEMRNVSAIDSLKRFFGIVVDKHKTDTTYNFPY